MNQVITAFDEGGFFMYPILVFAIVAMAIGFERIYHVLFRANINGTAFMGQVQKLIMANNIDRAIKLCNAEPNAALPQVLKAGLTRANRSHIEIEAAVAETTLDVFPQLNKRTPFLPMLANVSTLTGLLGTIKGLIDAFAAVAHAAPDEKQRLLAGGIAMAMYTTAGGLCAAIPILILHSFVQSSTTKIMDDVDQYALKTVNLLSARRLGTLKEDGAAGA